MRSSTFITVFIIEFESWCNQLCWETVWDYGFWMKNIYFWGSWFIIFKPIDELRIISSTSWYGKYPYDLQVFNHPKLISLYIVPFSVSRMCFQSPPSPLANSKLLDSIPPSFVRLENTARRTNSTGQQGWWHMLPPIQDYGIWGGGGWAKMQQMAGPMKMGFLVEWFFKYFWNFLPRNLGKLNPFWRIFLLIGLQPPSRF